MGSIGQPTPITEERDNSRLIIVGAVVYLICAKMGLQTQVVPMPAKAK